MRCGRVLQCVYQAQERPIPYIRHIGGREWGNNRRTDNQQIQYVLSDQEDQRVGILARAYQVQVAHIGHWLV